MRRGGTALVVLVVAAIGLAALVDALRDAPGPTAAPGPAPPPATSTEIAPAPRTAEPAPEPGGTLYFTDAGCELEALELPGQTPVDAPNWDQCRFVLSPDGRRVSGAGTGWDPHADPLIGRVFQSADGTIQVSSNGGPEGEPFAGTAPAWKPDGTLTYFADGAVRAWPSGDVLLSQRDLLEAVRRNGVPFRSPPRAVSVREAAWLDDRRLAVIASTRVRPDLAPSAGQDLLAVYDGARLATWRLYEHEDASDLRVSPGGNFVAVRYGSDNLEMLDNSGGSVDTLGIVGYRTVAWSPDDRWAAVAADGGVFVFRPGTTGPPELALDLDARDLDWRGGPGSDAASAQARMDAAADWLARVGVGGLLYVTQREGGSCRLRALRVPELEWADGPDEPSASCRLGLDQDGGVVAGGADEVAPTPSGRPTHVAGGELFAGAPGDGGKLLLSTAKLAEIMGAPAALEEVAWIDENRFWAVVRSEGADSIAAMTTERFVYSPWFAAQRIEGLRASAGMVAARSDRGVALLDAGGRRRLIFTNGRDVAWAPGELVAAVSTRDGIVFVSPVSGETVPLPLDVEELEWVTR
jgi:hypothetical protein